MCSSDTRVLYTDMLPLGLDEQQQSIVTYIEEAFSTAASAVISVGYISRASLLRLDELVHTNTIQHITLLIGMYYIEGMPESSYHAAVAINRKWQDEGIGEIRLVKTFKFHGKVYVFCNSEGHPFASVTGSANLGAIKLEASNRRQYELAIASGNEQICADLFDLTQKLIQPMCSANLADITDLTIIREKNTALENIDLVKKIPDADVESYRKDATDISFTLPIKVPAFAERHMDDKKHYTQSNLNVCYAAPRSPRKPRDWYEYQLTVSTQFTTLPGYPEKNEPFLVVTDDGYRFKAHTTSSGNKQFSAVGDELILGRWIKGRLVAAGLATPVNNTKQDTDRLGMITKEMLAAYGRNCLTFTKTTKRAYEGDELLDVWILSFDTQE